ncbi:hypothetical protein EDD27_1860 [Nonomuraea polychroma]|uniref:Uncharacterized protein n=1 Tax=Nonomuraea polychroma TaxID=46176 RepID=A0A438M1V5_9ACTN|nr:hypothetical protein EDD27_1860 [Nonomuraea polychroma]
MLAAPALKEGPAPFAVRRAARDGQGAKAALPVQRGRAARRRRRTRRASHASGPIPWTCRSGTTTPSAAAPRRTRRTANPGTLAAPTPAAPARRAPTGPGGTGPAVPGAPAGTTTDPAPRTTAPACAVTAHAPGATARVPGVMAHLTGAMARVLGVMAHLTGVMAHVPEVTARVSGATAHVLRVRARASRGTARAAGRETTGLERAPAVPPATTEAYAGGRAKRAIARGAATQAAVPVLRPLDGTTGSEAAFKGATSGCADAGTARRPTRRRAVPGPAAPARGRTPKTPAAATYVTTTRGAGPGRMTTRGAGPGRMTTRGAGLRKMTDSGAGAGRRTACAVVTGMETGRCAGRRPGVPGPSRCAVVSGWRCAAAETYRHPAARGGGPPRRRARRGHPWCCGWAARAGASTSA